MGFGSEIRDLGVKKAPDPGSGSATLQKDVTEVGCAFIFGSKQTEAKQ